MCHGHACRKIGGSAVFVRPRRKVSRSNSQNSAVAVPTLCVLNRRCGIASYSGPYANTSLLTQLPAPAVGWPSCPQSETSTVYWGAYAHAQPQARALFATADHVFTRAFAATPVNWTGRRKSRANTRNAGPNTRTLARRYPRSACSIHWICPINEGQPRPRIRKCTNSCFLSNYSVF